MRKFIQSLLGTGLAAGLVTLFATTVQAQSMPTADLSVSFAQVLGQCSQMLIFSHPSPLL
ncbi:MAG: hypothetical protein SFY80_02580 [Verrucomicrobiota bacterium]|nr:hypothetical protein [Verrucomicrobiota bacterium]